MARVRPYDSRRKRLGRRCSGVALHRYSVGGLSVHWVAVVVASELCGCRVFLAHTKNQSTRWCKNNKLYFRGKKVFRLRPTPRLWAREKDTPDFRAPYSTILINIGQHHDEAVCRGW